MSQFILEGDQYVSAKVESSYSDDAAPTAALNGMRLKTQFDIDVQAEELNYDAGRAGSKGQLEKYRIMTGSLEGYLAPSGTKNVAPAIMPFLRSAGFNAAVGADSVDLSLTEPLDSASSTAYFFRGKNRRRLLGLMSDWEINIKKGSHAMLKFPNAMALYQAQTGEASLTTPDLTAFKNPFVPDAVNFTKQNIMGFDANVSEVSLKGGNEVVFSPENGRILTTGRKLTADVTFQEPDVATRDFEVSLMQYGVLDFQLGTDVTDEGYIFECTAPNAQLVSLSRTFIDGISYLQTTFELVPTARNNEFTAKFR